MQHWYILVGLSMSNNNNDMFSDLSDKVCAQLHKLCQRCTVCSQSKMFSVTALPDL